MDLKSTKHYLEERQVIHDEIARHQATSIRLSKHDRFELARQPQLRFERLWRMGCGLLEDDVNRGGNVVGIGRTESGHPFSVKVSFNHLGRFGYDRDIEARWYDDGQPLGTPEIITESATYLTPQNNALSEETLNNLLLVEESIIACQTLRAQYRQIVQPRPIHFG